ncbi:hypothetical protein K8R03_02395 [Candidatus Kaiserbacteria bacterium]|nr:hypothetical protein [Candidatus Kaiserbacteria bacterium]
MEAPKRKDRERVQAIRSVREGTSLPTLQGATENEELFLAMHKAVSEMAAEDKQALRKGLQTYFEHFKDVSTIDKVISDELADEFKKAGLPLAIAAFIISFLVSGPIAALGGYVAGSTFGAVMQKDADRDKVAEERTRILRKMLG